MDHSTELVQIQRLNLCEICMLFWKNFDHIHIALHLRDTYLVKEQSIIILYFHTFLEFLDSPKMCHYRNMDFILEYNSLY